MGAYAAVFQGAGTVLAIGVSVLVVVMVAVVIESIVRSLK